MDASLRGILLGMSIGDGYIDARIPERAMLRVEHSLAQKDYAEFKFERLKSLIGGRGKLRFRERLDKRTGNTYSSCMFTLGSNKFLTVHRLLYSNRKKCFNREMLNMLTPEGIAYWYMDDGYGKQVINKGKVSSAYSVIYTYCTEQEAQNILDYFTEVWKIYPLKYQYVKGKWCIKFNTSESKKLVALIIDYIPECMTYKVNHVRNKLFQECLQTETKCLICGTVTRNKSTQICQSCSQSKAGKILSKI
jgi:hypothetical protein